jgi:arylsulfatase A-like enzyme
MGTAERDFISAAYDEEIAYVDAEVGRLLDGLQQRGVLDRSLVALTSDHGEELFEHDGFEHGHTMYDEVLRVPLILWGSQVAPGRESIPVSLLDLAPTILDAAGVAAPARDAATATDGGLPGLSLFDAARAAWPQQRVVIGERLLYGPETKAIVRWPYKAILEIDSGKAMLFDLTADPGERNDLAAQRPEELGALLGELAERLAEAQALGVAPGADIDEDLLRRLRALGYIR